MVSGVLDASFAPAVRLRSKGAVSLGDRISWPVWQACASEETDSTFVSLSPGHRTERVGLGLASKARVPEL